MKKLLFILSSIFLLFSCSQEDDEKFQDEISSVSNAEIHVCSADFYMNDDVSTRAAFENGREWGWFYNTIRVKFLNGDPYLQEKVKNYASVWSRYAEVHFEYVTSGWSDIRVAFKWNGDSGSWSMIGRQAKNVSENSPTMNFGWFDKNTSENEFSRTIVHEFGHALGLIHEHQHPNNGIQWNKQAVYDHYAKQGWDKAKVDHNIFSKYDKSSVTYNDYDKLSIMHYSYPASFTTNGYTTTVNYQPSLNDKRLVRSIHGERMRKDRIIPGDQILGKGNAIKSANGRYQLFVQNGQIVLLKDNINTIWSSKNGQGHMGSTPYPELQEDGNLIIYDRPVGVANRKELWSTKTKGKGREVELVVQDDGNVVLYNLNRATLWSTGTKGK